MLTLPTENRRRSPQYGPDTAVLGKPPRLGFMKMATLRFCTAVVVALIITTVAAAELSTDQIARLGSDLTPVGAERAGNTKGTIPKWTGGIKTPPAGYVPGQHHRDPYADDQPLFVIRATNLNEHRQRLSVGHQKMLQTYPTFEMSIYPTRRSASAPKRIYKATRRIAATARLVDNGNGVEGATVGIPFPIPTNGLEVIWNHLLRYRGETVACTTGQAVVDDDGAYTVVKNHIEAELHYWLPDMSAAKFKNTMLRLKQQMLAPPEFAGDCLLVFDTINRRRNARAAWMYEKKTARLIRLPNVVYDSHGRDTDGLRTTDQADMFNGAVDRYDWTLIGKREIYVPYNAYKVHAENLTFKDILIPHHPNPVHLRYELHRVWVVDARLKGDAHHRYKRRTFYVDEDSWSILVSDIYDNNNQFWRLSEAHVITYYEKPLIWTTLEVHLDLRARRYFAFGLNNEYPMCTWDTSLRYRDFTPKALRRDCRK